MISDLYINIYQLYRPSGSITSDGSYIETGSLYLAGFGRLEPSNGNENNSSFKFYCDYADITFNDTIVIDDESYNVKNVANYFNHHLEKQLEII